eukprot:Awhi_evm1s3127
MKYRASHLGYISRFTSEGGRGLYVHCQICYYGGNIMSMIYICPDTFATLSSAREFESHGFCGDCMMEHVKQSISSFNRAITCPREGCERVIVRSDLNDMKEKSQYMQDDQFEDLKTRVGRFFDKIEMKVNPSTCPYCSNENK